ncbi:MAG: GAF domain-containing protein [Deltaproteobacteria bacterium]|nr:GAF domain-containing protein [Deltaproteobacteria bacterium]
MKSQVGDAGLRIIFVIVTVGLITSVLAVLRYEFTEGIDPVLIFLLITYPLLIGTVVYFYLQYRNVQFNLHGEHYARWYLQSFSKVCLTEPDLKVIRDELTSSILRLIKPALVNVYEKNSETERLEIVQQAGIKDLPNAAKQGYPQGEGIPGWVMQNQNTVILSDITQEQILKVDPWAKAMELKSYAAVPIIVKGKATGIIAMYSLEANYFQDFNLLIAQIVAQLYGLRLASDLTPP